MLVLLFQSVVDQESERRIDEEDQESEKEIEYHDVVRKRQHKMSNQFYNPFSRRAKGNRNKQCIII